MTKIAETYLHINIRLSERDLAELQAHFERLAPDLAYDLFGQTPAFEVLADEGTVKIWIRVLGTIIHLVALYGGVRTAIDYGVQDARTFSELVLENAYECGLPESEIIRFERRLGVPGKLNRLFRKIDDIKEEGRNISLTEYQQEMEVLKQRLKSVLRDIDNIDDRELIVGHAVEEFESVADECRQPFVPPQTPTALVEPLPYGRRRLEIPTEDRRYITRLGDARMQTDHPYKILRSPSGIRLVRDE